MIPNFKDNFYIAGAEKRTFTGGVFEHTIRNLIFNMASDKECVNNNDINNVTRDENADETLSQTTEKSGWLLKRTKHSKQWKKKWFSLKERTMFYADLPDVSGVF